MAKMIPSYGPRDRDGNLEKSREAEMYTALSTLPDDFWVLHSYKMVAVKQDCLSEREADFIVFHPELGILCIEAKAGRVRFEGDTWRYSNGKPMPHGGPYEQASSLQYRIMDRFNECGCADLINHCKIIYAVWFPSIRRSSLSNIGLASDADFAITLSLDDLANPEPTIRSIFDINTYRKKTNLTKKQALRIVERVLCPMLDITPTSRFEYDIADVAFVRLLESQAKVLDFIDGEDSAAIRGAAGTGKTLIAVEYAKRASSKGEKTLYLCRTSMLAKDIQLRLQGFENADALTLDAFAKAMGVATGRFDETCTELALMLTCIWGRKLFPYQHVIIDEGQDFGEDCIQDNEIVELLFNLVQENKGGTLYMFYDNRQQSMGWNLPAFIEEADCKLTLQVNCRNSRNIAECAIRGADPRYKQDKRFRAKGIPVGDKPHLFISPDRKEQRRYINDRINELHQKGLTDIVIVTCRNVNHSSLNCYTTSKRGQTTWENTAIPFTTFTKFKGMEADAVILIDINSLAWESEDGSLPASSCAFYIAASRAKFELSLVSDMDNADCEELVYMLAEAPGRNPENKLAKILHAQLVC